MFILTIVLILLTSSFSYADNDRINYKNDLLIRENANLRKQTIALKVKFYEGKAKDIPVLLYHHIATEEEIERYGWKNNSSIISLESFRQQMGYLKQNDYHTATLNELELFIDGKLDLPKRTVVITFDDGYLSNTTYAYPVMREYGFKGSIFMVGETSERDESNLNPGDLLHIPAKEIYKYEDVFEFGCHTYGLHNKNAEGIPLLKSLSKEEIIEDLTKNNELFNTSYMAYPYGSYNLDTTNYLQELGYTMAFTVERGYVSKDSSKYELPRIAITPKTTIERFKTYVNVKDEENIALDN